MLFAGRAREEPDWYVAERAEKDPKADEDWRPEALASRAGGVFGSFLDALLTGESPDAFLAPGFVARTTMAPATTTVYDRGAGVSVRRGVPEEGEHGAEELDALAARLLEPFAEGAVPHPFFKTVGVRTPDEAHLETDILLHLSGPARGGEVQLNLHLTADWTVNVASDEVRLAALEFEDYEEVTSAAPLFRDLSAAVFGGLPRLREDFLRGIPEHRYHTDSLVGTHISGMQGMALGDVNGDGLEDLYIVQPGGLMNRLLLHRPDGTVEDASLSSGLAFRNGGRSALFFDADNDGDQDLAVSFVNYVLLAFNRGDGTFAGQTTLKLAERSGVYSLTAADPDQDGDLDLYCGRYSYNPSRFSINSPPIPYQDANNGPPNVFFRQVKPGRFEDATEEVGLDENNTRFTYAAIWEDLDDDGDVDLYVANDFGRNNLYRNDGGHFRDVAAEAGAEDRSSGMGVTAGDYDGDGDMDLYVSNMFSSAGQRIVPHYRDRNVDDGTAADIFQFAVGSTLLANRGDGTFETTSHGAGVEVAGWAWGAKFLDIDNDTWPDLYSPNGYITNGDTHDL